MHPIKITKVPPLENWRKGRQHHTLAGSPYSWKSFQNTGRSCRPWWRLRWKMEMQTVVVVEEKACNGVPSPCAPGRQSETEETGFVRLSVTALTALT